MMYKIMTNWLLLSLIFVSAIRVQAQGWEWQNPTPEGYSINGIMLLQERAIIAVCDGGFIMRSYDAGKSWYIKRETEGNLQRILRTDDGALLVVGDFETILRSSDQGVSWQKVYMGTDRNTGVNDLARVSPTEYVAVLRSSQLMHSTDGGLTWKNLPLNVSQNDGIRSLSIQSERQWWIVTQRYVYRSTDAGATWFEDNLYQARGLYRFKFLTPDYGYQLREGQLLRTTDAGVTWIEMNIYGFDTNMELLSGEPSGSTIYNLSAGNYIINKSVDAGETWNISLTGAAFRDAYPSCASFFTSDVGVVAGDGGRILLTTDGGISWSIIHGIGYLGTISDLIFTTPTRGMAFTYSNTMLLTSNGGNRWDELFADPDYSLRTASMYTESNGYAFGFDTKYNTAVFHTSDYGRSWTFRSVLPIQEDPFQNIQPQGIVAYSRDTVWIGASYGIAYRSVDGGHSWDSIQVSQQMIGQYTSGYRIFHFAPATLIYISSGGSAKSTDNGISWKYSPSPFGRYLTDGEFLSPDFGVALFSGYIGKTTNGGTTWTLGQEGGYFLLHYFDTLRTTAIINYNQDPSVSYLRQSYDGGVTWQDYTMKERIDWIGWHFTSPDVGWAFGYTGLIRHTNNGGIVGVHQSSSLPLNITLDQNYPNPFSRIFHGATSIRFTIPQNGRPYSVMLALYDALGRKIISLFDATTEGGTYFVTISALDVLALPAGVYFYRLQAGENILSKPLLLVK